MEIEEAEVPANHHGICVFLFSCEKDSRPRCFSVAIFMRSVPDMACIIC